jgi:DnaK suppressor protein
VGPLIPGVRGPAPRAPVGNSRLPPVVDPGVDSGGQVAARRAETLALIASLTRQHERIVEGSEFTTNDDEHDPEGSTIAFEREQVSALLADARTELRALDAADERIAGGTYGTCARCGGPIGDGRLSALPAATTCVTCADRRR